MQAHAGKLWAIGALSAIGLAYGLLLYFEAAFAPAGCCKADWPLANPIQAERLATASGRMAPPPAAQRALAQDIIKAQPANVSAWLRLAFADRMLHGGLTDEGSHALDVSYLVTPYAEVWANWRVMFILDNWEGVSVRTRTDVIKEIGIIKTDPVSRYKLELLTPGLHDAQGRIIAAVMGVLPVNPPPKTAAPTDHSPAPNTPAAAPIHRIPWPGA